MPTARRGPRPVKSGSKATESSRPALPLASNQVVKISYDFDHDRAHSDSDLVDERKQNLHGALNVIAYES